MWCALALWVRVDVASLRVCSGLQERLRHKRFTKTMTANIHKVIYSSTSPPKKTDPKQPTDPLEVQKMIGKQSLVLRRIPYIDCERKLRRISTLIYERAAQRLPWTLPKLLPSLPPYELREAQGKGLGLFATRNIAFGEVVLVERPILVSPQVTILSEGMSLESTDEMLWNDLESEARRGLMALKNVKGPEISFLHGLYATNAYSLSLEGVDEAYGGICLSMSRINHR
jgi:hypothetical protein